MKDFTVQDNRPVNLNLMKIKFPIPAIVSILHRISGVILFICVPLLLLALDCSLDSAQGFLYIKSIIIGNIAGEVILWLILSAIAYHLLAGIRHLMMDWGAFETLQGARFSSVAVFILFFIAIILLGVWLW